MNEKDKKILDIPDVELNEVASSNDEQKPNFILVSSNNQQTSNVTQEETSGSEKTAQSFQEIQDRNTTGTSYQENIQNNPQQENEQPKQRYNNTTSNIPPYEQYNTKAKNKNHSLKKSFFASMAGAVLGCSIFTGGYVTTTNLFTDSKPATSQSSQPSNSYINQTSNQTTTSEVVSAVKPGIVTVLTGDRMRNLTGNGSGIVYKNENGKIYVLTNAHVVADADIVEVYRNDLGAESADAVEVLSVDTENDIAVLVINKPEHEYPVTVDFENSDNLQEGQKVIAIGSPYVATLGESFSGSVTEGIISGLNREVANQSNTGLYSTKEKKKKYIQTDAAINGGNSGGALIDMNGNLVGINSAKISSAENMGLAISSNDVLAAMKAMNVPLPNVID